VACLALCALLYQFHSLLNASAVGRRARHLAGGGHDIEFDAQFLAANKAKAGVVTTASGLQYTVLRKGDGDRHPLADSPCECHYGALLVRQPDAA
jgi:FKBP-type peptidyl-prolyl cis-trans isomerase